MIDEHMSIKGLPDDDALIEDLHNQIMRKDKRIEEQQAIIEKQNDMLSVDPSVGLKNLRKFVTEVRDALASKQKRMTQAISAMDSIHKWLDERGVPKNVEEV